jgi:hypothetical protein
MCTTEQGGNMSYKKTSNGNGTVTYQIDIPSQEKIADMKVSELREAQEKIGAFIRELAKATNLTVFVKK